MCGIAVVCCLLGGLGGLFLEGGCVCVWGGGGQGVSGLFIRVGRGVGGQLVNALI